MDHGRYGQPEFTSPNPTLHFHPTIPSLVSDVPFYMHHQVLNPNAPPPPQSHHFLYTTTVSPPPPPPPPPPPSTYSPRTGWNNGFNGEINLNQGTNNYAQSSTIRWPRQETLTLLEIRSRLDTCFKEATSSNHKAPLWDEISRIMNDEYGYQRSGKKCKEKFENLYKYYKKTKEGKVGKNDGKHYRFFRQLEALFGDQHDLGGTNPSSQSNYSYEYNKTCNYEFEDTEMLAAIKESIELHFANLMVKQKEWGEKILSTMERKEQERMVFEEEWRKKEWARLDQEYESWARHVAHIKTRDKSILETLQNLIKVRSNESSVVNSKEKEDVNGRQTYKDWIEPEISSLIHIRTNKESKFQNVDHESRERTWSEVAFELSLLGYNRSENECKETWDKICVDFNKTKIECGNSSKKVSSRTNNMIINIDGEHSRGTM